MFTTQSLVLAIVSALVGASAVIVWQEAPQVPRATASAAPIVRDFALEIQAADVDLGGGHVWHAWTFNGSVPGPTLTAMTGDVLRVTVRNAMNVTHSFHTHLSPYALENDGSQLNTITGIGGMAMIPPGESYTYELVATEPGIFYYHCHSADGGHGIAEHIAQGLYGAIVVKAPEEIPVRDEVIFMSERGFDASAGAPYFLMNGRGLPGGEHALEEVFRAKGVPGVVAHLGTTIPLIKGRVGEPVRLNVINIGDALHSFHLHAMTAYSVDENPGSPVTAQVIGLVPGEAYRALVTPTQAGLWLFHCHVVSHADAGMIGVFLVEPREGSLALPPPDFTALAPPSHGTPAESGSTGGLTLSSGSGASEFAFEPAALHAEKPGKIVITFANGGAGAHAVALPALGVKTGEIAPGASKTFEIEVPEAGTYAFECPIPGHAGAGMKGALTVG